MFKCPLISLMSLYIGLKNHASFCILIKCCCLLFVLVTCGLYFLQSEVAEALKLQRKKTPKKRKEDNRLTSGSGSETEIEPPKPKKKKQKLISTGRAYNPADKLYCICKKPYDDTKYVFHG